MDSEKIKAVCVMYRKRFEVEGIPKKRMSINQCPQTKKEMLAHAHYLLDGIEIFTDDPKSVGKTGRHLGSVQTLLWVAQWYTLEELMNHNRPLSD